MLTTILNFQWSKNMFNLKALGFNNITAFNGEVVATDLYISKYANGAMAVSLFEESGEPSCTLSVNVPEHSSALGEGEFFLKNYSENEQMADNAEKEGVIIVDRTRFLDNGFVKIYIAKLNPKFTVKTPVA